MPRKVTTREIRGIVQESTNAVSWCQCARKRGIGVHDQAVLQIAVDTSTEQITCRQHKYQAVLIQTHTTVINNIETDDI
ncbi:hypothetical protein DPMN_153277 [Dreissena polymorpha]|uniref:Uncharacterized protein n=1 Tax=Dreissena polymorpha TaxID=45954 RepID=A0A9D4FKI0_DREPO|nr:hypothetical protein DPMN_153277 [Dreissena polymorpha]